LRRLATAVGIALPVILLAACSSGSTGAAGTTSPASPSGAAATGSGAVAASASPGSSGPAAGDAATGTPTREELFKGNEGTPPASSPPAAKGKSIWWISCGQQAEACAGYAAAGQQAAEALGWDFHLADGNLNNANGYATAMRTALAANPDAIVQNAFSCSTDQPELQQAKQQGVPVIGVETTDCSDAGGPSLFTVPMIYSEDYPDNKAWWTGWGQVSAEFIAADSGGNAKIITAFGEGDPQFDFLKAGFQDAIAKCSGCEVVADVPWTTADLAPNGAWVTALRNALVQHPDADYVWWPFDTNAVLSGGAKTVLQSGSKAKVVSGIGTGAALDLIRAGQLYAEGVARSDEWVSWAAIDQLNRKFNNESSAPQGLGFVAIDSTNNMPAEAGANYQTPVDFKALYKKAWGVD
jgi:ribose transport system substrate-binding protein